MVFICLLWKHFFDNLTTLKIPNHVISFSKRDIPNIKEIKFPYLSRGVNLNCSSIDLSKLESLSKHLLNF